MSDTFGDDVYQDSDNDAEYLDNIETLTGDVADEGLETSWSPPDYRPSATRYGTTELEQLEGESLDQRLAEEEPDINADTEVDEVPDPRAGRLVAPDEGAHSRDVSELIGEDVGIAGSAASAEEAAMHIVDEDDADLS